MEYNSLEIWGSGGPSTAPLVRNTAHSVRPRGYFSPEGRALQLCKNEIDHFYQEGKWDDYKKITNPYEYIFLSWNRRSSRSVTTRQPLSRSYFKLIEMWQRLDLTTFIGSLVARDGGLVTAHAAEGPGGFIEACAVRAEKAGWEFKSAYAITLRSDLKNVPGWRKANKFLASYPQIIIHDGADGTGNILNIENQNAFVETVRAVHPLGVHLFSADGGFDFSNDFNAQEDSIFPLLLAEILLGLRVLSKGGCMVIKCFDTTEQPTLDLIWLVSRAFTEWGVIKPRTSRAGNAERYIIGKGFHGDDADVIRILSDYQMTATFTQPILHAVGCPSWKPMMADMALLQDKIEHLEINVIRETLDLIRTNDTTQIRSLVRDNVTRSTQWCVEHDEAISPVWVSDLEKLVTKETGDLLYILNPPTNIISYNNSYYNRSTSMSHLSFQGFRTGALTHVPPSSDASNPFMRTK
jgi:23S rRNA U2552 (ribose-2'-O)-methylase RlmE/FtsJ